MAFLTTTSLVNHKIPNIARLRVGVVTTWFALLPFGVLYSDVEDHISARHWCQEVKSGASMLSWEISSGFKLKDWLLLASNTLI
jgi:hypothetical protein